jgi:protoporphyrinogen oxidase
MLGFFGFIKSKPMNKEETVKEFFSRNLGTEVYSRMVDAFVSGV